MTHPAILKAQSLYDECLGEELAPNQDALVAAVNKIGRHKATAYAAANRMFGAIPKQYRACILIIDQNCNNDLTAALETYELSLEYQDEIEDVALAMAEHLQAAE